MSFAWLPSRWLAARRPDRRAPAAPRATFRPQLESLEDRQVPATFNLSGTSLTINGTPGADWFTFTESTVYSGGSLITTYTFTMDDQTATYTNSQVTQVFMLGMGGNDSAAITLNDTYTIPNFSGAPQTLLYNVQTGYGGGTVFNASGNAFINFVGINNTYEFLAAGDKATMYTTPSNTPSTLFMIGGYSYTVGNGEFHYVSGASDVYGIPNNPNDIVYHYDAPGYNAYVADGNVYSYMYGVDNGQMYFNDAVGFNFQYAAATRGTGDTAVFYDSPGSDVFVAQAGYVYQYGYPYGPNSYYFDSAYGFAGVSAYSFMGGTDFAYVYGGIVTVGGNYHTVLASSGGFSGVRNF